MNTWTVYTMDDAHRDVIGDDWEVLGGVVLVFSDGGNEVAVFALQNVKSWWVA